MRALFVSAAHASPVNGVQYLRCVLPSEWGGYDRVALDLETWEPLEGSVGGLQMTSVGGETAMPDFDAYDVIVLDRNSTHPLLRPHIARWQANGTRVLADFDDYVHGVRDLPEPPLPRRALAAQLARFDGLLSTVDGIICATPFIAERYARFGPTFVAASGYDPSAHALQHADGDDVVIGWHGSLLGHELSMSRWLPAVDAILRRHPQTWFVSLGERDYASELAAERCWHVWPVTLADFPAAVNQMDVVLAPAGHIDLFRGKSDQRWLTAAALGIPTVVDPFTYGDVRDEITGLHATSSEDAEHQLERLVTDSSLRRRIGEQAQQEARAHRAMAVAVGAWERIFENVHDDGGTYAAAA